MTGAIAIVGLGGVGALLAALLQRSGCDVVGVASSATITEIGAGYEVSSAYFGTFDSAPPVCAHLEREVDSLLICVKSPHLDAVCDRVGRDLVEGGVVVPVLNGLGHVEALRRRFSHVAAASIGSLSVRRVRNRVEHPTKTAPEIVTAADAAETYDRLRALALVLEGAGVRCRLAATEAEATWEKLVRIGPVACACAAVGASLGEVQADAASAQLLDDAIVEVCHVAAAAGFEIDADVVRAQVGSLPPSLLPSLADDVSSGHEGELSAIGDAVLLSAARAGISTLAYGTLVLRARERATQGELRTDRP